MADITTTKQTAPTSWGNKSVVLANCASLATGSTWPTKLGLVEYVFVSGQGNAQDVAWSESGGIITFTVTAGPLLNVSLMAIGTP